MTVKELIGKLSEFPPETLVLIDGYEGGYEDLENIQQHEMYLCGGDQYMGDWDKVKSPEHTRERRIAILLTRFE